MVGVREVPRTATFTWSPDVSSPQVLATGTKAGAVDEGFSNDTQLEIWDFEGATQSSSLQPTASISTDSRFNDIAWTRDRSASSRGIIAGALDNGSLDLWDADKLNASQPDAFLSRTSKHDGAIKALQFNAFRSELLATVGAKGELFISDINNVGNPFRMGNAVARADDFECLDWNKRTSHIMVTGSSGGIITVWDIKNKRESLTLNNMGRKPVSAVAWDPVKTTRLITAIPSDSDPLILVWDLRNANAPERVLRGHDGGILSLSWCQQDGNLLLSCGKDNRNICWNPQTGESYGEFPVVTNWTFQTRWNPQNPSLLATASFDGKITVNPIQDTKSDSETQDATLNQTLDDEDFFNKAQSQPQGTKFSLGVPPKWLQRPCGATFGFGGKICSFKASSTDAKRRSTICISPFVVDNGIVSSAESFETSLKEGDLASICDTKIRQAGEGADKNDWRIIKLLTTESNRKGLTRFLGFSDLKDTPSTDAAGLANGEASADLNNQQDGNRQRADNSRLSAFFDSGADSDNFLSELAATKGAKINNPFNVYDGSESEPDRKITEALLLGKFEVALDVCLSEHRISDAFMVAICGGQSCIEKVQKAYFKQRDNAPNYLRLLASIVGKNLWDLVHNADLRNWKEVMATVCTYAEAQEFSDLCEALGDRLEERTTSQAVDVETRKDAAFCYLAGSKLEKVVAIWLSELEQSETSKSAETTQVPRFSVHARLLQDFIEKVTVFREVTHYRDEQLDETTDWKLASLYEKYIEYADIASAHGQLKVAERYLDLLPSGYAAASVAKGRIKTAMRSPAAQPVGVGRASQKFTNGVPAFQQDLPPVESNSTGPAPNQFRPTATSQNPYAPSNAQYGGPTYPNTGFQPHHQVPSQSGTAYGANNHFGSLSGPAQGQNASPSVAPPPPKNTAVGNWNDMPESFFKPPTVSRRGTPSANPTGPQQSAQPIFPPNHTAGPPAKPTPPLAPPPKAGAGPPRVTSPPANPQVPGQQLERPPSAANPYAPLPNNLPLQPQSTVPRGPSPYNAPPSVPPPSNRYAPSQPTSTPQPAASGMPLRDRQPGPPSNPYAPKQTMNAAPHGAPSQQQAPPPPAPPHKTSGSSFVSAQKQGAGSVAGAPQAQSRVSGSKHRK